MAIGNQCPQGKEKEAQKRRLESLLELVQWLPVELILKHRDCHSRSSKVVVRLLSYRRNNNQQHKSEPLNANDAEVLPSPQPNANQNPVWNLG
jgi:hypothetical protein